MSLCAENCQSENSNYNADWLHHRYGVRSYLHQFYEDCTASIWEHEDDFQIKRSPSRWTSVVWKIGLTSGTTILLIGLALIAAGYLVPPKIEEFGEENENFLVVDSHAVQFNVALATCKLAGAILFCIGGIIIAACLLMSTFATSYSKEEKYLQQKFKERIAEAQASFQPVTKIPAPGEHKIPITLSKVHNVQPTSET
ncbi:neurensin-1 [Stegostoma tigrinum]|uniref:neurensin-1 n=1 Tax=Stegostoma tigrinum TaxID=3053191 RepID=UPI00202B22C0|nr:neurensin-1 [Stegostoma tigrinum]XP_048405944.1 neurensin-1 [Stegostoma tigrinum]XP_048405954.1 neurensin-1 [Stegostoma tigrinum]XP_059509064.1 neurensin-1 [Stegostoma tigrinum]